MKDAKGHGSAYDDDEHYPGLRQRIEAQRAVTEAGLDLLFDLAEMIGGPYQEQGTIERARLWRYVFDLPAYNSAARKAAWLAAYPVG
jgi:hypothetical protein